MTEIEIYEKILECQDLLDKINNKRKTEVINSIVDRYNKYKLENGLVDITNLNNAVLENKIKNMLIQVLIISKINELNIPTNYQEIYVNIPKTLEEQEQYVLNLYSKYELVYKCYNLLIEIERLFEREYEVSYDDLKNSQYAKLTEYINNLYRYDKKNNNHNLRFTFTQLNNYLNGLSLEEKQTLYYESLSLCYNRNLFDFLNICMIIKDSESPAIENTSYQIYKQLVINMNLNTLGQEKTLEELYEIMNKVHNSTPVKQLLIKK